MGMRSQIYSYHRLRQATCSIFICAPLSLSHTPTYSSLLYFLELVLFWVPKPSPLSSFLLYPYSSNPSSCCRLTFFHSHMNEAGVSSALVSEAISPHLPVHYPVICQCIVLFPLFSPFILSEILSSSSRIFGSKFQTEFSASHLTIWIKKKFSKEND